MILLPPIQRYALRANSIQRHVTLDRAQRAAQAADRPGPDPAPVVKFFNPVGAATWLASELDADGVEGSRVPPCNLFGLADLGFGCPEPGSFSLREIASVRLPFGLFIERDLDFATTYPLSIWAEPPKVPAMRSIVGMAAEGDIAHREGSIREAEVSLGGP